MRKFALSGLTVALFFSACSCAAYGKAADKAPADAGKKDEAKKKVPTNALDRMDYAQYKIGKIGEQIIKRHQEQANAELKSESEPWRDEIRQFEKKYDVKLFDENWMRCCDDYDAATGEVVKGGYKPPAPPRQPGR